METHEVITRDGYILTTHRLVNPLIPRDKLTGLIVLQHGILCASSFYLLNSSPFDHPKVLNPNSILKQQVGGNTTSSSLAFALSNLGYDVWLTNFRGTQYSLDHLRPSWRNGASAEYWSFNVDTLVEFDLEAYVSYILRKTKSKTYTFIGHSLGATVGLGSLLVHQDTRITRQLTCSILMAPVASTQYMQGGLMHLFQTATLLYKPLAPFPGPSGTFALFARHLCLFAQRACTWLAGMFIGVKQAASDKMARNSSHNLWTSEEMLRNVRGGSANAPSSSDLQFSGRRRPKRQEDNFSNNYDNFDDSRGSGFGRVNADEGSTTSNEGVTSSSSSSSSPFPNADASSTLSNNATNTSREERENRNTDRLLNWSEYQKQVETFVLMMHQSVSVQVLKHIVQVHLSGRLSRFNYGPEENVRRYGKQVAPIYDLTQVKQTNLSLAIVSGPSDAISTPGEVQWIADQIWDRVKYFEHIPINVDPFNHMDLIMSRDAGELVNRRVIEFLVKNKCH